MKNFLKKHLTFSVSLVINNSYKNYKRIKVQMGSEENKKVYSPQIFQDRTMPHHQIDRTIWTSFWNSHKYVREKT